MDNQIDSKIEKLKELGLDEKRIVSLIRLGFEDFLDDMEEDLLQANEQDLDSLNDYLTGIEKEDLTTQEATDTLKDILKRVYGISAENNWNTFLIDYLDQCIQEGKAMEDFLTKLKNDDPQALKQVIAAQQDPDFEATKTAIDLASKLE
ncbi:MAG: hypothetical protein RBT33_04075 [Candidatus Dojkabacteria bacterium]|jgi:MoaA/NifB/PqqE/SkfB family radical SAM enzyme|nr:hypothetical protein [Candidatus Dojkabacteria bacterium]